jgi:hypothetical protein
MGFADEGHAGAEPLIQRKGAAGSRAILPAAPSNSVTIDG